MRNAKQWVENGMLVYCLESHSLAGRRALCDALCDCVVKVLINEWSNRVDLFSEIAHDVNLLEEVDEVRHGFSLQGVHRRRGVGDIGQR